MKPFNKVDNYNFHILFYSFSIKCDLFRFKFMKNRIFYKKFRKKSSFHIFSHHLNNF